MRERKWGGGAPAGGAPGVRRWVGVGHKEWARVPLAEKTACGVSQCLLNRVPRNPRNRDGATLLAGGGCRGGNEEVRWQNR